MGSTEARHATPVSTPPADGGRTPGDVTALLVELGRLLKARQFYPDRHPLLREVFERGFRAFETEIRRGGPLELELRQGAFRLGSEPVGRGRVDDLAQELVKRAVRMLRFDASLTPASLERFASVLALDPSHLEDAGGFLRALYREPCPGVLVNEMDYAAALAQAGMPRGAGDAGDASTGVPQPDGVAGIGVAGLAGGEGVDAGEALAAVLGLAGDEKPDALSLAQQLEQAPLEAQSGDDRSETLVSLLRELDACSDPVRYQALSRDAAVRASALADDGLAEEGFRALLVLSQHAGDRSRSEDIRQMALECLRELARGARLDDLLDRACAPGESASLRAAQILLRLGAGAVPALLRRVEIEQDLDRRGQLFGVLIAMGDATTPELCAAMQSGERRRAGVAVRLAGEMQNASAVTDLAALLAHEDLDLRREAAKALVRVGSPEAVEALVSALSSPLEDVAGHAAFCLGVAGGNRALQVLIQAARRDGSGEALDLAREAVRALGRMGRPESVPELAKLLQRRGLLRRKALRELKLAVVGALARIPGEAARGALVAAAGRGHRDVREAARQALERGAGESVETIRARASEAPPAGA